MKKEFQWQARPKYTDSGFSAPWQLGMDEPWGRAVSVKIGDPGLGQFLHYNYSLEPTRSEALWGAPGLKKGADKTKMWSEAAGKCKYYGLMEWSQGKSQHKRGCHAFATRSKRSKTNQKVGNRAKRSLGESNFCWSPENKARCWINREWIVKKRRLRRKYFYDRSKNSGVWCISDHRAFWILER